MEQENRRIVVCTVDASFVGTVEKDATTLAEEHKALFAAANKKELDKKKVGQLHHIAM